MDNSLLPIASVLIEPAKILFMNNAINHGVLGPLGVVQAEETGKSILFMLETNPGPGLGILVAFWLAGPKLLRGSAPGAIIIHFLGGIHEIYFPYVLLKPQVVLGAIVGGAVGVATFMVTGVGLVATPSPGSIFAYLAVTLPVTTSVCCSVSFSPPLRPSLCRGSFSGSRRLTPPRQSLTLPSSAAKR